MRPEVQRGSDPEGSPSAPRSDPDAEGQPWEGFEQDGSFAILKKMRLNQTYVLKRFPFLPCEKLTRGGQSRRQGGREAVLLHMRITWGALKVNIDGRDQTSPLSPPAPRDPQVQPVLRLPGRAKREKRAGSRLGALGPGVAPSPPRSQIHTHFGPTGC